MITLNFRIMEVFSIRTIHWEQLSRASSLLCGGAVMDGVGYIWAFSVVNFV